MKRMPAFGLCLCLLLCGCTQELPAEGTAQTQAPEQTEAVFSPAPELSDGLFSDRDYRTDYEADAVITLEGSTASVSGSGAAVEGSTVTVSREGTYLIRGSLENGQLIVDSDKQSKVQLVLENASIHSEASAALYVRQADKVFVTLAEGTENTLSGGETFEAIDENNIDAAIFSKEDLTVNGSGSLQILSPGGHGIVSKDEMTLTGGVLTVRCAGHGLSGKDNICIDGTALTVRSGKDGIQSDNDGDDSLGFVYIASGSFDIEAEGDGISASSQLRIDGGSFRIVTGGGCENGETHTSDNWGQMGGGPGGMGGGPGGMGGRPGGNFQNTSQTTEDSTSIKGLKAGSVLEIYGGTYVLDCADDAIHANGDVTVAGGSFQIATGDDGFHADSALVIRQGVIAISESYEGLEGLSVEISGGDITLKASDDGLNAAGGADESGFGGFRGGDRFASDSDSFILISGGTLFVNAAGDGVDSNGDLTVTGGTVTVEGPTDGANGPLDYAGSGRISGGTVRVTGSVQMAQSLAGEGQGVLGVSVGSISAGTAWEILDSKGNVVLSGQPGKAYACIVASSPDLVSGETYTLKVGTLSGQLQAN